MGLKRDFPDDDSELLNENHKGQGYSDETGIKDFLEKFYATEQELKQSQEDPWKTIRYKVKFERLLDSNNIIDRLSGFKRTIYWDIRDCEFKPKWIKYYNQKENEWETDKEESKWISALWNYHKNHGDSKSPTDSIDYQINNI